MFSECSTFSTFSFVRVQVCVVKLVFSERVHISVQERKLHQSQSSQTALLTRTVRGTKKNQIKRKQSLQGKEKIGRKNGLATQQERFTNLHMTISQSNQGPSQRHRDTRGQSFLLDRATPTHQSGPRVSHDRSTSLEALPFTSNCQVAGHSRRHRICGLPGLLFPGNG